MKILDLGCGKRKRPGSVGIDINPNTDADIIHNLNQFPYPFSDSEFDEIYVDNVIEHLEDVFAVMEELRRISRPEGLVTIYVPYFRSHWAFIDSTHRHFFTVDSFSYLDPGHIHHRLYNFYSTAEFRVEKVVFNERVVQQGSGAARWFVRVAHRLPGRLVTAVANRWPRGYESYLSTIWPLDELTFYLRTHK